MEDNEFLEISSLINLDVDADLNLDLDYLLEVESDSSEVESDPDDELNFEQIADYFFYDKDDLYFYKFWNFNFNFSKKNVKKVKSSIKLWTPILAELLSDSKIFDEITFLLNFKNLSYSNKKGKFLNWWGRVKNFLHKKFIFYEYFYFYKNIFIFEYFYWIKWQKSIDWKLKIIYLNNYFFFSKKLTVFIQIFPIFLKKKKQFSWHLPQTKLNIAVNWLNLIDNQLNFWTQNYKINENYLFLFYQTISLNFINKISNLEILSILIFNYKYFYLPSNYLIVMFFFLLISSNSNITAFLILFFYLLEFLYLKFFSNKHFAMLELQLIMDVSQTIQNFYLNALILNKERFIRSYAYNKDFKIRVFYWFFNKDFTHQKLFISSVQISFQHLNTQILEVYKGFCATKIHKFFWFYNSLLNEFESKLFYSTSFLEKDNFSFEQLNNKQFISFNWLKLFYFELEKILSVSKRYLTLINFSIEPIFNYLLYLNKYLNLDSVNSHISNNFFYTFSFFNGIFFFWKLYYFLYKSFFRSSTILIGIEIWFFKKKFVFWWNKIVANLFFWGFSNFSKILIEFVESPIPNFFKKWIKTYWFWFSFFFEEFLHLANEFTSTEFERLQEILWTKQFSELRVIKLTNYLKLMREKKIDPGNIQHSPDFTQQHEFALLLKWGLELEILRTSRQIVEKWFYGFFEKPINTNFIRKKINFLYNARKPWFKRFISTNSIIIYKPHLILNLSSVYEIIRLSLATVLSSYQIFFKIKWQQLDHLPNYLPRKLNEWIKRNIYNFLNFIHDRFFIIFWYWEYYIQTGIKKKISFPKMIKKKVFNKFIEPYNIFFEIENFWNSFNFFIFKFFWWLKWNINVNIRNEWLYETLHWLIFKRFSGLHFPNHLSMDDQWVINLFINRFKTILPLKNLIFYENYFDWQIIDVESIITDFSFDIDLCELDFIKITFFKNFNFLKILSLKKKYYFFNFFQTKKLKNNIFFLIWQWIDKTFINFFTEFFYDQFVTFISSINLLNNNKWNKNFFVSGNLYSNISSENFSISFFSFLENWFIWNKDYFDIAKKKFFFSKFEKFILKKFIIELFYKNLIKIYFKLFWTILEIKKSKYNKDFHQLNNFLIITINSFVIKYIWSDNFWKKIIKTFLLRLLKFPNDYKSTLVAKLFLFEIDWLWEFSNNLEIIFLNFLTQFLSFLNWK